jgi:hypothetical protein
MITSVAILLMAAAARHECTTPEGLSRICTGTSIVQLIATPEKFEGAWVRTHGVASIEFEGMRLCLDEKSLEHGISVNCLWLEFSRPLLPTRNGAKGPDGLQSACSGRYVLVAGYFTAERRGHKGAYTGTIREVERISGHPMVVSSGETYHGCDFSAQE